MDTSPSPCDEARCTEAAYVCDSDGTLRCYGHHAEYEALLRAPSVESMLDDLRTAGWTTMDPRIQPGWTETNLRIQWARLQREQALAAITARLQRHRLTRREG